MWALHAYDTGPDAVYLIGAIACVLVPLTASLAVLKHGEGFGLVMMIAVIAPVIVWFLVICATFVATSMGDHNDRRV